MLKSVGSKSKLQFQKKSVLLSAVGALLVLSLAAPRALAQGTSEFTLSNSSPSPDAVAPGGTSSSSITIGSVNGFAGTVNLSCQIASTQVTTTSTPVCTVSPPSVTPPATATATITTTTSTTTIGYSFTITGTGPTTTYTTPAQQFTVLSVTPQFTITIETAVAPSSVVAGSGAQGVVSINPINGYSTPPDTADPSNAGVYLSCTSITPLVTAAPVCSFAPPHPKVISGSVTSTLTISTFGPVVTGSATRPRTFYALWLPLPMLALAGIGVATGGRRSRRACGLLMILVVSGSLLLLPACSGTNNTSVTTPNGTTPANSYTFTIIGVDTNGVVSSNTGTTTGTNGTTTTGGPSVSLTVTAPTAP